jgi:hypothetical protein
MNEQNSIRSRSRGRERGEVSDTWEQHARRWGRQLVDTVREVRAAFPNEDVLPNVDAPSDILLALSAPPAPPSAPLADPFPTGLEVAATHLEEALVHVPRMLREAAAALRAAEQDADTRLQFAGERAKMLLDAKNHWADRALAAEQDAARQTARQRAHEFMDRWHPHDMPGRDQMVDALELAFKEPACKEAGDE